MTCQFNCSKNCKDIQTYARGGVILVISLLFLMLRNSRDVIKYFGWRYALGIQRWGFDPTVRISLQDLGRIKSSSFLVSYIKAHEYHFLFSSSQFRVFRAFKPPNPLTIRSFITLSKSLQRSSRTLKISSCFNLRKFLLQISLYLLGQPPRPVIFSSTNSEWVGLSV